MALRGKKPELIEKRFKAFFYGVAKSGKTTCAINFPKPYLIDTERGAENKKYVETLKAKEGQIFQTTDFNEVKKEVLELLTTEHPFKTLIIDPMTIIYNDLIERCSIQLKAASKDTSATGTEFGRHVSEANKHIKSLINLLLRLDMNVIITSHAKTEYGDSFIKLGETYDCYKKMDYIFDLIIEVQKRVDKRIGIVKGTRIDEFKEFETFLFSYDEIANRYGREQLERDAVPEILASSEQLVELQRLIELLKIPQDDTDKWLAKASADTFAEMKAVDVQKCIDHLEKLIKGDAK